MPRADQVEVPFRIVIERPVPGVVHSLQDDDRPLDPKQTTSGEPLEFDFPVRIGPGPKYFGRQVRRESERADAIHNPEHDAFCRAPHFAGDLPGWQVENLHGRRHVYVFALLEHLQ